jgi:hypothetical protein
LPLRIYISVFDVCKFFLELLFKSQFWLILNLKFLQVVVGLMMFRPFVFTRRRQLVCDVFVCIVVKIIINLLLVKFFFRLHVEIKLGLKCLFFCLFPLERKLSLGTCPERPHRGCWVWGSTRLKIVLSQRKWLWIHQRILFGIFLPYQLSFTLLDWV